MPVNIDANVCGHIQDCPVFIVPENCDDCDLCIQNCPNQAISKA